MLGGLLIGEGLGASLIDDRVRAVLRGFAVTYPKLFDEVDMVPG